jgi:hypothetical protein
VAGGPPLGNPRPAGILPQLLLLSPGPLPLCIRRQGGAPPARRGAGRPVRRHRADGVPTLLAARDQSERSSVRPDLAGHKRHPGPLGAAGPSSPARQHPRPEPVPHEGRVGRRDRQRLGSPGNRLRARIAVLGLGLLPIPADHDASGSWRSTYLR